MGKNDSEPIIYFMARVLPLAVKYNKASLPVKIT